jgi:sugar lactone lactonase YvrE
VPLALTLCSTVAGCWGPATSSDLPDQIWGRQGISAGRLQKPRAMTIDAQDDVYIVDMSGRIQVFRTDGQYQRGWRTPAIDQGKPCGLSFARDGSLLVADTHYFRILTYTPQGELLEDRTLGGEAGTGPGQFNFVTDVVQDSHGCYYVSEYGQCDRVQKFAADGRYLFQWGGRGRALGEFSRPQSLAVDAADRIWVADACNHRIQIFEATGPAARLVGSWGEEGDAPGQLCYPYGIALDGLGHVYVSEFGNHRVQKFTQEGCSLGCWGTGGRRAGELSGPWAVALDSQRRVFILDTYNHRVQQIRL